MKSCSELSSGVSPRIHSECGVIWASPTPNAKTFHEVDVGTMCIYIYINFVCLKNLFKRH